MKNDIKQRVVLVTGGTRGIGAAISKAFLNEGYRVAANYHGNIEAAKLFRETTGVYTYRFDVADYETTKTGLEKIEADLGPIDVVIANAGITRDAFLHKMSYSEWTSVIHTNLDSLFNVTQPLMNGMRARKFGRIIAISSINGQKGQFGQTNYAAAKAGMVGFVKSLALEGATKNITANVICPGYINTEMVSAMPEDVLNTKIIPLIPVGRLGTAEEIARIAVFLAADDSGFITGSTITANGGQYLA